MRAVSVLSATSLVWATPALAQEEEFNFEFEDEGEDDATPQGAPSPDSDLQGGADPSGRSSRPPATPPTGAPPHPAPPHGGLGVVDIELQWFVRFFLTSVVE